MLNHKLAYSHRFRDRHKKIYFVGGENKNKKDQYFWLKNIVSALETKTKHVVKYDMFWGEYILVVYKNR